MSIVGKGDALSYYIVLKPGSYNLSRFKTVGVSQKYYSLAYSVVPKTFGCGNHNPKID